MDSGFNSCVNPFSSLRRNKHGCEMCRCIKCPPFTCDKHCSDGYRHNKKGCSVCMCKGKYPARERRTLFPPVPFQKGGGVAQYGSDAANGGS